MSFFFKSSNEEGAKDLYQKSQIYNLEISEDEYNNLIDFEFAEKYLYGRVNYSYVPIVYNSNAIPLAGLNNTNTNNNNFVAAPYVVKAFNDLNNKFLTKTLSGELNANDQFLGVLEVKKAYIDPRVVYNAHLTNILSFLTNAMSERSQKFSNIQEFIPFFNDFLQTISKEIPITLSGFIKSRFCPVHVSGLVIEIADIDYANDEEKIRSFKQSPNWKFYLNTCRSYGFLVDSSNPFRLIANIGSNEMIEYAKNEQTCRFDNTVSLLSNNYVPAHLDYIDFYKRFIYDAYNLIKLERYLVREMCADGITITKEIETLNYSFNDYKKIVSDAYCIESYIQLRINEEKAGLENYEILKLTKDTISLSEVKGVNFALNRFEKIVGQTYNYSGSLTDLFNRVKIKNEGLEETSSETFATNTNISGY